MIRVNPARIVASAALALLLVLALASPLAAAHRAQRPRPRPLPREGPAPVFDLPLPAAPLDTPLVITGGFGEYRIGHFHAGFDFSTGGLTGKKVYAPLAGHIERIRSSGVGYGRSLYLRTIDGRTIQFGHLDAFVEPIASWVRAIQDSSGQYEQDLWPEASRFPIRQGQQIAWTGQSGAGGPHMHFEIRRGDMAYQPMRAGLRARDNTAPQLVSLTLEPLDDTSYVERGAAPYTIQLAATPETLTAIGRVRAIVGSRDGRWSGVDRMQPWLTRMDWDGQWIEARFDSVSWATDMVESDYVYDAGRVVGEKGLVLWAPPGWRPRVIRASVPLASEAGTIVMRAGDAPKTLALSARDASGNRAEAKVVVKAPRPGMGGPDPGHAFAPAHPTTGDDRFDFFALPGRYLRIVYRGGAAGSRDVRIGIGHDARPACSIAKSWCAVVRFSGLPRLDTVFAAGRTPGGREWRDECAVRFDPARDSDVWPIVSANNLIVPDDARFEGSLLIGRMPTTPLADAGELQAVANVRFFLGPETEPLRKSLTVNEIHVGYSPQTAQLGLYRRSADGWDLVETKWSGGFLSAETRHLGWFALFSDTTAPRIGAPVTTGAKGGAYPRWAIEVSLSDRGSGVDARASWIEVDGRRRPSEWDPEAGVLRWRPPARLSAGAHHVDVVASDKAGNVRRRSASLVLD